MQTDDFGTCPATSLQLMPLLRYVCKIDQYAHSKQEDTDFSQSTAEKRQELELHVFVLALYWRWRWRCCCRCWRHGTEWDVVRCVSALAA